MCGKRTVSLTQQYAVHRVNRCSFKGSDMK